MRLGVVQEDIEAGKGIFVRKRYLIIGGIATIITLGAVSAGGGSTDASTPTTTTVAQAPAAPAEDTGSVATGKPVAAPTSEAAETGSQAELGKPVKVDDDLTVTVLDAKIATKNGDYQKPAKGYVYLGIKVRYEATAESLVNMGDWNVLADGSKQGQWALLVGDKWEPTLPFDQLAAGATTEGWITFEVPKPDKYAEIRFDNDFFSDEPQLVLQVAAEK